MHACMYCMRIYVCAKLCMHLCVYACMYICTHVCIHVCIYVIFKLGFERYGGNCPSWEGNCPGEVSGGELSRGEMSVPPIVARPCTELVRT